MTAMSRRLRTLAVAGGLALGGLGLAATPASAQVATRTVVPYRAPAYSGYYTYAQPVRSYTYAPAPVYTTSPRYIGNFNKRYPDWSTDRPVPMAKPWMRPLRPR